MPPEPSAFPFSWLFAAAAVALGGVTGCFSGDNGRAPDENRIYFPVGIALGPTAPVAGDPAQHQPPRRMYVANSDFDLQYNAGTLQVFDLERLSAFVPQYCEGDVDCEGLGSASSCDVTSHFCMDPKTGPCGALGVQTPGDRLLFPGFCGFLNPYAPPRERSSPLRSSGGASLLVKSVQIGAFVTDVAYRDNPLIDGTDRGRLFLPVRGDATLHWVDVDDASTGAAALDCGQGAGNACDQKHRRGGNPLENTRGLKLPPEPFGIAIDDRGEAVVTTHQSDGEIALFVNPWEPEGQEPVGPNLAFVLGGLPSGALAIASIPEPGIVSRPGLPCLQYQPGFLMTFRNSAQIRLVHYFSDKRDCTNPGPSGATRADAGTLGSDPLRPFLEASSSVPITTNSQGYNSRGIAIDPGRRKACETACADTDVATLETCLKKCAAISLDVYVSNRTPATLILGHTLPNGSATSSDDLPSFYDVLPLQSGPSRVFVGKVLDVDGKTPVQRIFIVCFDSRLIYVYDPAARRFETEIRTGRGPHAFAIDADRGLGYVGHFTDSYLGVVDLNRGHTGTYGKMLLTVGEPVPPRASK
jgi:hypothetical protein